MNKLAAIYLSQGKYGDAQVVLDELLPIQREKLPRDSPRWIGLLAMLSRCQIEAKQFAEAETLLRESLAIREKILPDSWLLLNTKVMLGAALLGQDKHSEAEPLLSQGYAGIDRLREEIPEPVRAARQTWALEQLVAFHETRNAEGDAEKLQQYQTLLDSLRTGAETEKQP